MRHPGRRKGVGCTGSSIAKAVQACLQLEREGLTQVCPCSGYFVRAAAPPVPAPRPSRRRTPSTVSNPMLQDASLV